MRRKDHDHVLALRRFRLAYVLKGSIFTVDDLMPPVRMRELTRRRITAFLVAKLGVASATPACGLSTRYCADCSVLRRIAARKPGSQARQRGPRPTSCRHP
jgi:hypothetical protein